MTSPAILPINSPAETVISATRNRLTRAPRKQLVLHCRMMLLAQGQGTEMKSTVTGIAIGVVIGSSIKKDDKEETHSD